jgi:hypothetical protein
VKTAFLTLLFLSFSLCGSISVMAQDLSSLLEKAENTVKTKNPSRELVSKKRETDKEVVYQWGSVKDGIRLLIFYGASEQEASEKMNFFIGHISVGPDKKLDGIGDEAYLWKSQDGGFGAIRFRKSNVFVDLVAPSVAMAEDLARSLADLIPGK